MWPPAFVEDPLSSLRLYSVRVLPRGPPPRRPRRSAALPRRHIPRNDRERAPLFRCEALEHARRFSNGIFPPSSVSSYPCIRPHSSWDPER